MKRLFAALLVLTLWLAACSRPAPNEQPTPDTLPPPPSTTAGPGTGAAEPAPPAPDACLPQAPESFVKPYGNSNAGKVVRAGLCPIAVAAEGFWLNFDLPPTVTEETARAALRTEGAIKPQRVEFHASPDQATLQVIFDKGAPGDEGLVRLMGPVGEGGTNADLGYRVRLMTSPTASAEVQVSEGPWQPLAPGITLPQEPIRLRIRFSARVSRGDVEYRLKSAFEPRKDDIVTYPYRLSWPDETTALVEWATPRPGTFLELSGVRSEQALGVAIGHFETGFYTGEPPRLAALDPATGQEERLGPAPVDIWSSNPSPDGQWAILSGLEPTISHKLDLYLVDIATGQMRPTGLWEPSQWNSYFWLPGRLVIPAYQTVQVWDLKAHQKSQFPSEAQHLNALSPDQRYLAGFSLDYKREDPNTWLAPTTLVIHDLTTHKEQVFRDIATYPVPHKSSPPHMRLLWSADGRTLFFEEYTAGAGPNPLQPRWMALDLATGKVAQPAKAPEAPPMWDPVMTRNGAGWGYTQNGWGPVRLTSPQGQVKEFDHGLIVGWRADGRLLVVRWPNYPYMRHRGI